MSRTIFKGLRHLRASKETEADAGPSVPSQRALDALADAVRRAREATDATGVGDPMRAASSYPRPTAPAAPKPVGDATARRAGSLPLGVDATARRAGSLPLGVGATARSKLAGGEPPLFNAPPSKPAPWPGTSEKVGLVPSRFDMPTSRTRTLRRVAPFGILALALLAVAILAVSLSGISRSPRLASAGARPGTRAGVSRPHTSVVTTSPLNHPRISGPRPAPTAPSTTAPAMASTTTTTPTATTTATTTTTSVPASDIKGSGPQLSSITPWQSSPGAVVTVHGTNLYSSNGVVLARFDGQPTRTVCPTQTSCKVTVPPLPGSPSSARVTITTAAGTSNALVFVYA